MGLQSFKFEDIGPLKNVHYESIPSLTVIAGPNGVGKSTLLESIAKSTPPAVHHIEGLELNFDDPNQTRAVYFSPHRVPTNRPIFTTQLLNGDSVTYFEGLSENSLRNEIPGENETTRQEPDYAPYYIVKRRMAEFYRKRKDILDDSYDSESGELDGRPIPEPEIPFQDSISDVLPGLDFEEINVETHDETENEVIRMKFGNRTGDTVYFDQLSSGEQDAIAILFLLTETTIQEEYIEAGVEEFFNRDILVLIDSPESHLHPDLQKRLFRHIREYLEEPNERENSVQFIICTHSKVIIDRAQRENLFYLLYPDMSQENQFHPAEAISDDLLRSITGEMGLAALSSGRDLLWVEGPTDEEIYSRLCPSLEDEFTILVMGDDEQVKRINDAFNTLIPELLASGREIFAIVDGDRSPALEGSIESRVHTLPTTCVENLLLDPPSLYDALRLKYSRSQLQERGYTSAEDINDLIVEITNRADLKREEVWTRFNEEFNPINVNRSDYYYKKENDIVGDFHEYVNNVVDEKMESTRPIEEVEHEVNQIVERGDWDRLNGKEIIDYVSSEFDMNKDELCRLTAKMVHENDSCPSPTTEFFQHMLSMVD